MDRFTSYQDQNDQRPILHSDNRRMPYNLYCVGGDVKHCTIQSNPIVEYISPAKMLRSCDNLQSVIIREGEPRVTATTWSCTQLFTIEPPLCCILCNGTVVRQWSEILEIA